MAAACCWGNPSKAVVGMGLLLLVLAAAAAHGDAADAASAPNTDTTGDPRRQALVDCLVGRAAARAELAASPGTKKASDPPSVRIAAHARHVALRLKSVQQCIFFHDTNFTAALTPCDGDAGWEFDPKGWDSKICAAASLASSPSLKYGFGVAGCPGGVAPAYVCQGRTVRSVVRYHTFGVLSLSFE